MEADEFLRPIAGTTCPCGHDVDLHEDADPDIRLGDLRERCGACTIEDCDCKGLIE